MHLFKDDEPLIHPITQSVVYIHTRCNPSRCTRYFTESISRCLDARRLFSSAHAHLACGTPIWLGIFVCDGSLQLQVYLPDYAHKLENHRDLRAAWAGLENKRGLIARIDAYAEISNTGLSTFWQSSRWILHRYIACCQIVTGRYYTLYH